MKRFLQVIKSFLSGTTVKPDESDTVDPVLEKLKLIKEGQEQVFYYVKKALDSGLLVRARGANGFVSYAHLPWRYSNTDYWKIMQPYLKDGRFVGLIYAIASYSPPFIIIDGKIHKFRALRLKRDQAYDAIVVSKTTYSAHLELGYDSVWEHGSILHTKCKESFKDAKTFHALKAGDLISVVFRGYNYLREPIFNHSEIDPAWLSGEIRSFIGTTRDCKVERDESGTRVFWVDDRFKGFIPVNEALYPDDYYGLKQHLAAMDDGDVLSCEVNRPHPYSLSFILIVTQDALLKIRKEREKSVERERKDKFLGIGEGQYRYTVMKAKTTFIIVEKGVQVHLSGQQLIQGIPMNMDPFGDSTVVFSNETAPVQIIRDLKRHLGNRRISKKGKDTNLGKKGMVVLNEVLRTRSFLNRLSQAVKEHLPFSKIKNASGYKGYYVMNSILLIRLTVQSEQHLNYGEWWNVPYYTAKRNLGIQIRFDRNNAYISVNDVDIDFAELEELSTKTTIRKVIDVLDEMGALSGSK